MTGPVTHRPSAQLLADRLAEICETSDRLMRRNAELCRESERARERRSQIRAERLRLLADSNLRLASGLDTDRRAAAAILEAAMSVSGMPLGQLWLDYVALGGSSSITEMAEMLEGRRPLDRREHDRLALALNERLDETGHGRLVAYWDGTR